MNPVSSGHSTGRQSGFGSQWSDVGGSGVGIQELRVNIKSGVRTDSGVTTQECLESEKSQELGVSGVWSHESGVRKESRVRSVWSQE